MIHLIFEVFRNVDRQKESLLTWKIFLRYSYYQTHPYPQDWTPDLEKSDWLISRRQENWLDESSSMKLPDWLNTWSWEIWLADVSASKILDPALYMSGNRLREFNELRENMETIVEAHRIM
jgi:hypothetical protein